MNFRQKSFITYTEYEFRKKKTLKVTTSKPPLKTDICTQI